MTDEDQLEIYIKEILDLYKRYPEFYYKGYDVSQLGDIINSNGIENLQLLTFKVNMYLQNLHDIKKQNQWDLKILK